MLIACYFPFCSTKGDFFKKRKTEKKQGKHSSRWMTVLTTALTICLFNSDISFAPKAKNISHS